MKVGGGVDCCQQGDGQGADCKGEEKVQEKRRERPELKVVICKDGRSSARVSLNNSFSPPSKMTPFFSVST